MFAQVGDVDNSGNHRRSLGVGKNVLTAPDGTKGYAIYFANKVLPSEQKYVEVNLAGAKELKLVVTDGGNGNGSDHANFADAKLYRGISNIDVTSLENLIKEADFLDGSKYTEESFANLTSIKDEAVSVLSSGYTKAEIDSLYEKLNEAKNSLEKKISKERAELIRLLDYSYTITKNMVGTSIHLETRWYNFVTYRSIVEKSVNDESLSEFDLMSRAYTFNYIIEELRIK